MSLIQKSLHTPGKVVRRASRVILRSVGNRNYRHFIILTRSRTGSNMLSSMLRSHPSIEIQGEIFSRLEGRDYRSILENAFSKQPYYVKASGFKIFYYHPLDDENSGVWDDLVNMENLHVIQLKRKNILRSLVSSKIAMQQDQWLSKAGGASSSLEDRAVSFSSRELIDGFTSTQKWISRGEALFAEHPLITLNYEEIVEEPELNIRKACEFLGVRYYSLSTELKRQNPESLRELVRNYDVLKKEFSGSEWEAYFDD